MKKKISANVTGYKLQGLNGIITTCLVTKIFFFLRFAGGRLIKVSTSKATKICYQKDASIQIK